MDENVLCLWHQKETVKQKTDKNLISPRGITPEPVDRVEKCIRQVESKHDLLQYKVDGWCVWPLFRLAVGYELEDLHLTRREMVLRSQKMKLAFLDILSLFRMRPSWYVVKTFTSGLMEKKKNSYQDIWFDDLLEVTGDYYKIEVTNNPVLISRRKLALIRNDLTTNLFDSITYILARLPVPMYISKIAKQLSSCVLSETGLNDFTARRVKIVLFHFYWQKRFYSWLLRRLHAKYLMTASPSEYAIVAAAREQGIKVIEFLHGYAHRHHHGYSWQSDTLKQKPWMPIPDRLFLYGEHGRRELETNGFWDAELRVVGSLRMDRYRKCKAAKQKRGAYTLLVTTQGIEVEKVIQFMVDFLEAAQQHIKLCLYFKLHPAYETEKTQYEASFEDDTRVRVILGTESPSTYELLTWADVHASISSTCHYEALGLRVPTVILPFSTHEVVLSLYEAGHAFLAQTPRELRDIVLKCREIEVPEHISEFYFKSGALENMRQELRSLS